MYFLRRRGGRAIHPSADPNQGDLAKFAGIMTSELNDDASGASLLRSGEPARPVGRVLPVVHLSEARCCIAELAVRAECAPAERLRLLCALDDACQAPSAACVRERLALGAGEEARGLGGVLRDFWQALLDAYEAALRDAAAGRHRNVVLAAIGVRMMRAGLHLVRWMAFDGEPPGAPQWRVLTGAYFIAEAHGAAELGVPVRADRDLETSMERGYLALLAIRLLGLEQFAPADVELGIRLTLQSRARLELSAVQGMSSLIWVDPECALAPARLRLLDAAARGARFFSAAAAVPALQRLLTLAELGRVPAELAPPEHGGRLVAMLEHMVHQWSGESVVRAVPRQPATGTLSVLCGFEAIVACLQDGEEREVAAWVLSDVTVTGVGALVAPALAAGLEPGRLLALRLPGEARWRVGVLRRRLRRADGMYEVGVALLGAAVACPMLSAGADSFPAIALDALLVGVPARFLLPAGTVVKGALSFAPGLGARSLQALGAGRHGRDHVLQTCLPH